MRSDSTPAVIDRKTTLEYALAAADQPYFALVIPNSQISLRTDLKDDILWTVLVDQLANTAVSLKINTNELCNVYWQASLTSANL